MSTIKHFAGAILFVLIFCGSVALYRQRPDLPADKSLIKNFQKHRADFEKLARMVNEDRDLRGIIGGHLHSADSRTSDQAYEEEFSEERLSEYHLLFSRLIDYRVERLLLKYDRGLVILVSSDWIAPDDVEKGYFYSRVEPGPLVGSLDKFGFASKGIFYKKIDEHWYLYFEGGWGHGC